MPFQRPTLTQLIQQCAADIASSIPGADALLRFSNLATLGKMFSGLTYLHYGYQDWIAKQAVPFTATDEFLEGWAALKGVIRKPATVAGPGAVTFINCTPGKEIVGELPIVRGDGVQFVVTQGAVVDGDGEAVIQVSAVLAGAAGNTDVGVVMTLGVAIAGVQSSGLVTTAIAGGADTETDNDLRNRMLAAYQNPPQGGAAADFSNWALEVPGVTRAWCRPHGLGAGTVLVYFMMDLVRADDDGFPQGTNGVATLETRASAAVGDQLVVANYIFPLQPVTALVYAYAPTPSPVNFTIDNISGASAEVKAAIDAAIDDVFFRKGSPGAVLLPDGTEGGTVDLSDLESAIAAVAGTAGFVLTAPADNITVAAGALATRGSVVYT